jgi:hypothetical protein
MTIAVSICGDIILENLTHIAVRFFAELVKPGMMTSASSRIQLTVALVLLFVSKTHAPALVGRTANLGNPLEIGGW